MVKAKPMTQQLPWHHVHLTHKNRESVARWYARHLGARRGKGTERSENLWYGNNLVQVQSDTAIKPSQKGALGHIGLGTPRISETISTAVQAGATRMGKKLIADPWGTLIQFVRSEKAEFHHLRILCMDPAASGQWYATHMGGAVVVCPWETEDLAIRYDTMWLVLGRAASIRTVSSDSRPICHAGWYTSNIDKTVDSMLAAGCKFPVPIMPFGPVRLAFAEDPSGLWVELLEPPGGKIPK
jgi:catechol 2,3-dioxygenase-like lactoylglutathione lyase family enzyme